MTLISLMITFVSNRNQSLDKDWKLKNTNWKTRKHKPEKTPYFDSFHAVFPKKATWNCGWIKTMRHELAPTEKIEIEFHCLSVWSASSEPWIVRVHRNCESGSNNYKKRLLYFSRLVTSFKNKFTIRNSLNLKHATTDNGAYRRLWADNRYDFL